MGKTQMLALLNKIDSLQDENHQLMIERDLLKKQVSTIKTTDQFLIQDIKIKKGGGKTFFRSESY